MSRFCIVVAPRRVPHSPPPGCKFSIFWRKNWFFAFFCYFLEKFRYLPVIEFFRVLRIVAVACLVLEPVWFWRAPFFALEISLSVQFGPVWSFLPVFCLIFSFVRIIYSKVVPLGQVCLVILFHWDGFAGRLEFAHWVNSSLNNIVVWITSHLSQSRGYGVTNKV